MDALRVRLGSVVEWAVAAAFFAATLAVAMQILQNVRASGVRPVATAAAPIVVHDVPSAVPRGAVSLPALTLRDGKTVQVGDSAVTVAATLGAGAETGREETDQGRLGLRVTRFYDHGGFRFVLVYEPFERNGERRVSAIYLP
jgi:hypothetical protein